MAFATKIVNREIELDSCKPLLKPENAKSYAILKELLKPAVKEVIVGVGDKAKKIGGKLVMYRHEFTYKNPTAIAIDVTDEMSDSEIVSRVQKTDNFTFEYIGNTLKLDMIAVRCTSGDADKFKACVKKVSETTKLPMILCTMNPAIAEAGLMAAPKARPLLYAANATNWKDMAELAIMYDCPIVASSPNDLTTLVSLAKTLMAYGVKDIVLRPRHLHKRRLTRHNQQLYHATKSSNQRRRRTRRLTPTRRTNGRLGRQRRNSRRPNQMARSIHSIHACCPLCRRTHHARQRRMGTTTN